MTTCPLGGQQRFEFAAEVGIVGAGCFQESGSLMRLLPQRGSEEVLQPRVQRNAERI